MQRTAGKLWSIVYFGYMVKVASKNIGKLAWFGNAKSSESEQVTKPKVEWKLLAVTLE